MKRFLPLPLPLLLLPLFFMACARSDDSLQKIVLIVGETEMPLRVEIADDPAERSQGLMHRTQLPEDQGMLFVFSEPQQLSFWMKNTLIPLDVLFFDTDGNFVSVQTMEPCTHDPCKKYSSIRPALYALELNAGFYVEQLQPLLQRSGGALQLRFPGG